MVSRRTRSYKDKRPAGIFGQFMLPLAVIMAIVLLYFSIKLFFLNSNEVKTIEDTPGSRQTSPDTVQAVPAQPPAAVPQTNKNQIPTVVAGPVGDQTPAKPNLTPPASVVPPAAKPPTQVTPPATAQKPSVPTTPPAAAQKPSAPTTPPATAQKPSVPATPPATAAKPPAAAAVKRYDVQIGAFSSRDNAVQLLKTARSQGYEVYVNEPPGAPAPYRVRVKGTADRQRAEALSAKLKEQGYPVYIIAIN